jgi:ketosteroid isomerase-like protein
MTGGLLLAQRPVLEPVLQAELAFARQADQKGIRAAFLTWLAADALVFTPRMVSGRDHYGALPGDPGQLIWYPEAMGIAASGELAWSHGPWTYAVRKGEAVLVHGHFLSLWQRQVNGTWRVVADIGVPHGAPERAIEPFAPWDGPVAGGGPKPVAGDALLVLGQKEAALSAAWAAKGGVALLPELAAEARALRPGSLPVQGIPAIQKILVADRPGTAWAPARIHAAASGDLGWTCGETGADDRGRTASFLRIWIREAGDWKVLFDVKLPHPSPTR